MSNFTLISTEVDAQLARAPPQFWSTAAAICLAFGAVFAFSGSRLLRTAGFVFGCLTGGLVMAIILSFTAVGGDVWLGLVITFAIVFGLVAMCVVRLSRLALVVALGFTMAMVIMQYCLSYIQGLPAAVEYTIIVLCVLLCAYCAYKAFAMTMIVASATVGGFLVLIGTAYFMNGPLSPAGWWFDPSKLVSCTTISCWAPLIVGGSWGLLGFFYQLGRVLPKLRQANKVDAAAQRARKQEAERFNKRVDEMRRQQEAKVARQTAAMREEARKTQEERTRLSALAKTLEAERARVKAQDAEVQRRLRDASRGLQARDEPLQANEGHRPPPAVDLRALQAQREAFRLEQEALEQRNVELRERMRIAEVLAVTSAATLAEAERKAHLEAVKSAELEEALAAERRELQKLLREALDEKKAAEDELVALRVDPAAAAAAAPVAVEVADSGAELPADNGLEAHRGRLREKIAEAEALEAELQAEMGQLLAPEALFAAPAAPPPLPPNKPQFMKKSAAAAAATATTTTTSTDAVPPELPARPATSPTRAPAPPPKTFVQHADVALQLFLEGLATVIVTIYVGLSYAVENCMKDAEDRRVESIKRRTERRPKFSGDQVVDRFRAGSATV